jgi:hypothetical protein
MTPKVDNIKTVPADSSVRQGRLTKANRFFQAAADVQDLADEATDVADVVVTLYVHAGIAASDSLCAAALGKHAKGDDHGAAVTLLATVDLEASKALNVLLGMKTRAGYGHDPIGKTNLTKAERAAQLLIQKASST